MSLMDLIQSDDPAMQSGLLNFGLSLLRSKGSFGNAVGHAGVAAQAGAQNYRQQQALLKRAGLGDKLMEAQIQEHQLQAQQREQQAAQARQARQYLTSLNQGVQGTQANAVSGVTGPRPEAAAVIGQRPPIDPLMAIQMLGPEKAKLLIESKDWGAPQVARTVDGTDAQGNKVTYQLDNQGRIVGQGIPGYVAPQLIDQGDKKTFAVPKAGASFDIGMSPTDLDQSRRGWAGVGLQKEGLGLQRERLAMDKQTAAEVPKPGSKAIKVTEANEAIAVLDQADKLIKGATGSYVGNAVDTVAQAFGIATPGSIRIGQLQALEGALISKMPKMSGPQSDKDVLLYKQMAGQIGDPNIPYERKAAAMQTVREIQERYAGITSGGATGEWEADKEARYQAWKRRHK